MSMTNDERGSVLMEFIVVLPIYMLLLGFAFVVGEFSLDAIHLAGAGDRSRAFSSGEYDASTEPFEKYKLAASPDREAWDNGVETEFSYSGDADMGGSAKVSEYENTDSRVYVADGEIAGPWVEMAAGMVVDSFTLPPWTRGIVAFWYRRLPQDGCRRQGSVGERRGCPEVRLLYPAPPGETRRMGCQTPFSHVGRRAACGYWILENNYRRKVPRRRFERIRGRGLRRGPRQSGAAVEGRRCLLRVRSLL